REIGIQHDQRRVALPELEERLPVGVPQALGLPSGRHRGGTTPGAPSSTRAFSASSFDGAFPCQDDLPSMNDTPFPFTVRATIAVGPSVERLASASAPRICRKSCPSISRVR